MNDFLFGRRVVETVHIGVEEPEAVIGNIANAGDLSDVGSLGVAQDNRSAHTPTICEGEHNLAEGLAANLPLSEANTVPADPKDLQAILITALRTAILEGKGSEILKIKSELAELPVKIFAQEVASVRADMERIDNRLPEIRLQTEVVEKKRKERNAELATKLREVEPYYEAVAKTEQVLFRLDNEKVLLLDERRDLKRRLDDLLATAEIEMGGK